MSQPRQGYGLLGASATYAIAGTIGKLAGLITVPVLTRTLGQADYGLVDLTVGLITLAAIVGGMSAELPAAAMIARAPARRSSVLTTYLAAATIIGSCLGLAVVLAHEWIARDLWQQGDAAAIAVLAGAAVPLTAAQWGTWNIHRVRNRPRVYAALSAADLALKATAMIVAAFVTGSAMVIVAVYVAATAAGAAIGVRSIAGTLSRPDFGVAWPLLVGGASFTVIAVASIAALYTVRALVAQTGLSEVGDMAVSVRLAGLLALPLAAFQLAWGPASIASSASTETKRKLGRSIVVTLAAGGLAGAALSLVGPESIELIAGSVFAGAERSLPGLTMAAVLGTAFFMLSVAASVEDSDKGRIIVAAVMGAVVQVGITAVLLDVDVQSAVSLGALAGPGTAVLLALGATTGLLPTHRIRVAIAVAILVAVGVVLVRLVPGVTTMVRWPLATVAAAALGCLLLASLRPRSQR